MRAWRTGADGSLLAGGLGTLAEAGLEAGHTGTGVEDLLLARVERVALGADLGTDGAAVQRGAGGERRATGAADLRLDVLGVDVALQGCLLGSGGLRVARADCASVNRGRRTSLPGPAVSPKTRVDGRVFPRVRP